MDIKNLLWSSGFALIEVCCLVSSLNAVGDDKAIYLGGTTGEIAIAKESRGWREPPKAIEVRILLGSESEIVFDAGQRGTLKVPYASIASLEYGKELGPRLRRPIMMVMPWDPFVQFTKNAHHLLSIGFIDGKGVSQGLVVELGRNLARTTLETVQARSGKTIEFVDVDSCLLFKTAEVCGIGDPRELKGLSTVSFDPAMNPALRKLLHAELEKASGLKVQDVPEGAQILLKYSSDFSFDPGCPCEGGRGEVHVVQGSARRVVLVFNGAKKGIWGKPPLPHFARTFIEAFNKANGISKVAQEQ